MFSASPLINQAPSIQLKRKKLKKKELGLPLTGENLHMCTHTRKQSFPFQHLHLQAKRMNKVLKDALT